MKPLAERGCLHSAPGSQAALQQIHTMFLSKQVKVFAIMTADQEMISQLKLPASAHFLVLQAVQVANAEVRRSPCAASAFHVSITMMDLI